MKILQVVPYFYPAYAFGGPPRVAYEDARQLVKRHHEVTVYTSDAKDFDSRLQSTPAEIINNIRVRYLRNLSMTLVKRSKLLITPQLVSIAKDEIKKFDVVHLHEYRTFQNVVIHHYAEKYGVPYVFQAHGSIPRIVEKQRLKLFYDHLFGYAVLRDASKLIALSQSEAKQYVEVGLPKHKIEVIPNGVDLSEYDILPSKGSFKRRFGIPENMRIILYLGRIHKVKGIDTLVKAYASLIKNTGHQDTMLVIVGPDDGYMREVKSLIDSLKLTEKSLLVGPLYSKDKLEAYVDSDIFVLPSIYETFPTVILEIYACSKPVIASRIEALQSLVVDGKTGLFFEKNNVGELVHRLDFALRNPSDYEKMGHEARQFVEKKFSIRFVLDKLESLYEEVKGKR